MSKGLKTRQRIVDHAVRLASRDGLGGLTVGTLASALGLSKSGLFAHFGSKEELQLEVLRAAAARFEEMVLRPASRAPRGLARLRKLFDLWLRWIMDPALPGGCVFVAAAAELDDKPGRARDFLVASERQLLAALVKAAQLAIETGELDPRLDCEQLAFELHSLALGFNYAHRLLHDRRAEARARKAFDRLVARAAAI